MAKMRKTVTLMIAAVLWWPLLCGFGNGKGLVSAGTEEIGGSAESLLASMSLGLTGVGNEHELGGYCSSDGRTVRRGVLLRSASLAGATEEDLRTLRERYHLALIADFRMDTEAERAPDPELDGVRILRVHIMDAELLAERSDKMSELLAMLAKNNDSSDSMAQLIATVDAGIVSDQMYVEFLMGAQGKTGYRQLYEELLALPEGQSRIPSARPV